MTVDFFQLVNAEMLYTQPPPLYTGQVPCWSFLGQALDLSVYFPAVFLFQRNILAYVLGFTWQNQLPQLERGVDMCQVSTGWQAHCFHLPVVFYSLWPGNRLPG